MWIEWRKELASSNKISSEKYLDNIERQVLK